MNDYYSTVIAMYQQQVHDLLIELAICKILVILCFVSGILIGKDRKSVV